MAHLTVKWVLKFLEMYRKLIYIFFFFQSHAIRAVYGLGSETMEITGPQMVLTMKLTTFAWNVYDGRRKVEVRFHESISLNLTQMTIQELDKWQAAKRVTKYPTLLEFLGYSSVLLSFQIPFT